MSKKATRPSARRKRRSSRRKTKRQLLLLKVTRKLLVTPLQAKRQRVFLICYSSPKMMSANLLLVISSRTNKSQRIWLMFRFPTACICYQRSFTARFRLLVSTDTATPCQKARQIFSAFRTLPLKLIFLEISARRQVSKSAQTRITFWITTQICLSLSSPKFSRVSTWLNSPRRARTKLQTSSSSILQSWKVTLLSHSRQLTSSSCSLL